MPKWEKSPIYSMKRALVIFAALLLLPLASAGEAGEDITPDIDSTPFASVSHQSPSQDGVEWTLDFVLDDDLNYTSIEVTTQICTNDGVCDQPITTEFSNGPFSVTVTPPEDHTYVNWRIKVIDGDNSTKYPSSKWYKAWSDCWYDVYDSKWGGDNCPEEVESEGEESSLPFMSISALLAISLLAARTRRDGQ